MRSGSRRSSLVSTLLNSRDGDNNFGSSQLDTFMGVFLPCICTIFGVVIYLRMGFLVGQAGLFGSFLILGAAFTISLLTVLSLSALVSSGDVGRGGLYDGVRKSVGPEFGAVIGILFYCAYVVGIGKRVKISLNSCLISFLHDTFNTFFRNVHYHLTFFFPILFEANYSIGFAHALVSQTGIHATFNLFPWNPPGTWVETVVASLATLLAAVLSSMGVVTSSRVLFGIFILIILSVVTSMTCLLVSTTDAKTGHTAFSAKTLANNTGWDLTPFGPYKHNTPWLMFTLLFPGFTGVIAGANLSGELRTPHESIAGECEMFFKCLRRLKSEPTLSLPLTPPSSPHVRSYFDMFTTCSPGILLCVFFVLFFCSLFIVLMICSPSPPMQLGPCQLLSLLCSYLHLQEILSLTINTRASPYRNC